MPAEYKLLCAEVLHLLRGYRAALARFEETQADDATASEMLAACEQRALPLWRSLWHQANEIVAPLVGQPDALAAVKRFTELLLTPEFMGGKIWRRSYEKPLGYPGDFEIMNQVYAWRREGGSLYDQLLHRLGLEVAECIATRMVMMRQVIAELCLDRGERVAHIANIGCGPAREVIDYLQMRALPSPVNFTLLDQDHGALTQAYQNTYTEVIHHKGRAGVSLLHTSFSQLLKAGELFGELPPQDLIYSVGLIDYLAGRRATALVHSLYDRLAPGGRLVIGNMFDTPTGNLWPMECHLRLDHHLSQRRRDGEARCGPRQSARHDRPRPDRPRHPAHAREAGGLDAHRASFDGVRSAMRKLSCRRKEPSSS